MKNVKKQSSDKQTDPRASAFKITVISASCLALACSGISLTFSLVNYLKGDAPITFTPSSIDGNSTKFTDGSIADIAEKVSPSVVSILTETRQESWFGQSSTNNSAGTGMIVTSDGLILTNKHVIDDADSVSIILSDGTTYTDIGLVGTDPLNDIAFLKISNVSNLTAIKLGNSKTISPGQQVIAIGNALGQYQNSVTEGIISGTGRSISARSESSSIETLSDMIQTDASINPGNSGGPLVNAAGEVIGINTAVSSNAQGIGFAIPISSVKGILKNIVTNNKAERAYAGFYYASITPAIAKQHKLPSSTGAFVYNDANKSAILKNSAADKAGLKDRDVITEVNGNKVGTTGSISTLLGEYAPGDTVQLKVLRGGKEIAINLTLEAYRTDN